MENRPLSEGMYSRDESPRSHSGFAIVFVHLGPSWIPYLLEAIAQARLFNPESEIFLIADAQHKFFMKDHQDVEFVSRETVPKSRVRKQFEAKSQIDSKFRNGFWRFAIERFFVIHDFMIYRDLGEIVHLESDNLIYFKVDEFAPLVRSLGQGLSVVKDNDRRCIPSVVWVVGHAELRGFLEDYNKRFASKGTNDMDSLGTYIDTKWLLLPVVHPKYLVKSGYLLRSQSGGVAKNPLAYGLLAPFFGGVFDGAAIGQLLGGTDRRNSSEPIVSYTNESAVYQYVVSDIEWGHEDRVGWVPYLRVGGELTRVLNLHIHSKELWRFVSTRNEL